ncbi:MAG: hetI [Gammaproteobacteria bacterium]|jgi:phosphopantetheine--protein transferase-like protein|nr:hetI [Gammaproteobacteria bacterium]
MPVKAGMALPLMLPKLIYRQLNPIVHLYATRFSVHNASDYYSLLSEEEQLKAQKKAFPQLQDEAILSLGLRRAILAKHLSQSAKELVFSFAENQKPILVNGPYFNVSHSQDYWVIAIADQGPIGIDIEDKNRPVNFLEIAKRFFAPEEYAFLAAAAEPKEMFWRYWTAKEALVKASGKGIVEGIDKIIIDLNAPKSCSIKAPQTLANRFNLMTPEVFLGTALTVAISQV